MLMYRQRSPHRRCLRDRRRKDLDIRKSLRQQMHINLVLSKPSIHKDPPDSRIMQHQIRRSYLLIHNIRQQTMVCFLEVRKFPRIQPGKDRWPSCCRSPQIRHTFRIEPYSRSRSRRTLEMIRQPPYLPLMLISREQPRSLYRPAPIAHITKAILL